MLLAVGYENYVDNTSIVVILKPHNAPAKKLWRYAIENGMFINATSGKKAKSLIVIKSNHVVLSALHPDTLKSRIERIGLRPKISSSQGSIRWKFTIFATS